MTDACDPKDIALKSFFLGPQAENGPWLEDVVSRVLQQWFAWRRACFPQDGRAISEGNLRTPLFMEKQAEFREAVFDVLKRYEDEVPKFSPRYIGHMFSEISLPGLLGHLVTLLHNPNNISGEVSVVGTRIEMEAIEALLTMLGMNPADGAGHFTSGGTLANMESLVRARERSAVWLAASAAGSRAKSLFEAAHSGWEAVAVLDAALFRDWIWTEGNPWEVRARLSKRFQTDFRGPVVLVPENKHYSWKKGVSLLGLGDEAFWTIDLDSRGKLSVASLEKRLEQAAREQRPVMSVVSVAGTTEMGEVDPVHKVNEALARWEARGITIWHHVDAAYGGFFRTLGHLHSAHLDSEVWAALEAIRGATSVTLDPHKLGYVPYASGAFVCRERRDYWVRTFDSPYLAFDKFTDRGPFTIEGSRSAAGATATWLTAKVIGFEAEGYGRILARTIRSRQKLEAHLASEIPEVRVAPGGETNIVAFHLAQPGEKLSLSNARTLKFYDQFSSKAHGPFVVSKTALGFGAYRALLEPWVKTWSAAHDTQEVVCIRACILNPFFDSIEMKTDFVEAFTKVVKDFMAANGKC